MIDYLHTVMLLSLYDVFAVLILTVSAVVASTVVCRIMEDIGQLSVDGSIRKRLRNIILCVGGALILLVIALKATSPSALPKNSLDTPNTLDKIEVLDKEETRESVETPLDMNKVDGAMDGTEDSKERTREMLDWKSEG